MPTLQYVVYESCVEKLVDGLFDGYNATVLAYGQVCQVILKKQNL